MADLNSWEDDKDAQDDANLAQRTAQQLQMNAGPGGAYTPNVGANSFQPGASSFQPQNYGQYGGYAGGQYQQSYDQTGYSGQQQQYGQYQQYNQQGYGGYGGQPQAGVYGNYQAPPPQQVSQQRQTPVIAKRPAGESDPSAAPKSQEKPASGAPPKAKVLSVTGDTSAPPKAKVLSITGDTKTPKVEKAGQTKVLTLGTTVPPASQSSAKENVDKSEPAAGSKVTAAKALEKAGEGSSSSPTAGSGKSSPTGRSSPGRSSPQRAEARQAARVADAVQKEQEDLIDENTLKEIYGKEHVNVIFLGHVDAGKSTLGGSILVATGMVDERTLDKYRREAKEAGRETWYLSWALDLTKEERLKGKTVEVGRGFFETDRRRYSILDAPGHKTFVPNMIGGASQADVGVLVISARKGEYETGFEKGGQTREHAMLAKTQGVNKLIVVVNKMDDITVEWSEERYKNIQSKLTPFLKGVGYNPKDADLIFMPVSAQTGLGVKQRVTNDKCSWYDGPSLLETLDNMKTLERKLNAPFMMPIAAKYKDMGTMIEGKIESGVINKSGNYLMMPNRESISISALYGETEEEIPRSACGDQVRLRIRGAEEEDILPGFVLCSPKRPVHCVNAFEAQIVLLDLKSILSAGYNCVMHVHAATEEVTFTALLHKLEKGTGRKSRKAPGFATKGMSIIARLQITGASGNVCVERFEDYPQLGRFTLRDQGQTIAIGKITKLITDETPA
ncbi:eukaryotic peptide chain release factor GTP-binding subunit [Eremomyces bilateralis CBS 781.70]|uniref:Elongation factor 1-alpha n=1 Tax=Eremomyces bilateralis CBS 781.70 TaxID=1392243 RepID=A0A6G1FQT0_9PEZI|nr:eukaryotic peptide chain release factor GTP-binding subunit [Eremomyces bilateralis CBS 781.70]KAF1808012.1 eukaryotic peptide chain release factor GTP-binding subunit [Eremomyces bilateralis CBS 781.70]